MPEMKTMTVLGGPADMQVIELPAGGAVLKGGPFDGFYLDEGDHWRFIDARLHRLSHKK